MTKKDSSPKNYSGIHFGKILFCYKRPRKLNPVTKDVRACWKYQIEEVHLIYGTPTANNGPLLSDISTRKEILLNVAREG